MSIHATPNMASFLRSLIQPPLSQWWLSEQRMRAQRAGHEKRRMAQGAPHQVHYFHQSDDPYCALLSQMLPDLLQRYAVDLVPHLVGPAADPVAPDRARLVAHSRKDAELLAQHHGLRFHDGGAQPTDGAVGWTNWVLCQVIEQGDFVAQAAKAMDRLWSAAWPNVGHVDGAGQAQVAQALAQGEAKRARWGHYLGGTFYYAGEWYWGLDRLYHLEQRLQDLGAWRAGSPAGVMFPPPEDLHAAQPSPVRSFDFFLSLRSPYTAIVAQRVLDLARHTGAQLNLRFLLPMAMRGLAVPRAKRMYIAWDTAREARARGVPVGRLLDPLGVATERGLAVLAAAMQAGMGEAFLLSFLRGVWSEGVNASTDAGLRRLALRAGLSWAQVQDALNDERWRASAEANRQALLGHGLWGVPAFRVGTQVFWGQDRLWAVQQALLDERNAR